ncbi:hypothetical protein EYF80_041697 [Liparis tanakae]|uniref:Uncharacterized protein n=1 Tax=Liparis tanakae TaxID=230148 RepID=A0A4Z2G3I6_9TELE|nr:hypothetical protein EYF80_041697 [Liparis tanakae]
MHAHFLMRYSFKRSPARLNGCILLTLSSQSSRKHDLFWFFTAAEQREQRKERKFETKCSRLLRMRGEVKTREIRGDEFEIGKKKNLDAAIETLAPVVPFVSVPG